jgi:hypothetical protein
MTQTHQSRILVWVSIIWTVLFACPPSPGKQSDDLETYRSFAEQDQSATQTINAFTVRNFSARPEKRVTVNDATVIISLITPINSQFNRGGDTVQAEVLESHLKDGSAWLPKGAILTGTIEGADRSTYCRTDGKIYVRFYTAQTQGTEIELSSTPTTSDNALHPRVLPPSKKKIVRNILMSAAFIAVPLAIGTGGTTLAITAGAGAVIGGVLADKGQHLQGAVSGAWEGSGLGLLDPVVRKGKSVILPAGTTMALQLQEPARVPASIIRRARQEESGSVTSLEALLKQNDLASAFALVDRTLESAPTDSQLLSMKQRLMENVTDTSTAPEISKESN